MNNDKTNDYIGSQQWILDKYHSLDDEGKKNFLSSIFATGSIEECQKYWDALPRYEKIYGFFDAKGQPLSQSFLDSMNEIDVDPFGNVCRRYQALDGLERHQKYLVLHNGRTKIKRHPEEHFSSKQFEKKWKKKIDLVRFREDLIFTNRIDYRINHDLFISADDMARYNKVKKSVDTLIIKIPSLFTYCTRVNANKRQKTHHSKDNYQLIYEVNGGLVFFITADFSDDALAMLGITKDNNGLFYDNNFYPLSKRFDDFAIHYLGLYGYNFDFGASDDKTHRPHIHLVSSNCPFYDPITQKVDLDQLNSLFRSYFDDLDCYLYIEIGQNIKDAAPLSNYCNKGYNSTILAYHSTKTSTHNLRMHWSPLFKLYDLIKHTFNNYTIKKGEYLNHNMPFFPYDETHYYLPLRVSYIVQSASGVDINCTNDIGLVLSTKQLDQYNKRDKHYSKYIAVELTKFIDKFILHNMDENKTAIKRIVDCQQLTLDELNKQSINLLLFVLEDEQETAIA